MASICIDGFNIALPNGSGIATFGRNLLGNARAAGYGTQVLYGPRHGRSKNPARKRSPSRRASSTPPACNA
jgi:hypothetical protein